MLKITTNLFAKNPGTDPFLVGVSGGADSVALLHLLLENNYRQLVICHYNHQLRGSESDDDACFVEKLAASLDLPYEIGSSDVKKKASDHRLSLEAAAREARYEFFAKVAQKRQVKKLFLAHHSDDQVETCLFNFLRGSGSAGLAGMLPVSYHTIGLVELEIIRPLLSCSRKELRSYLKERNIIFRHDSSNDSLIPTRNRLRHAVLPLLDDFFGPTYRNAITRTATILGAEDAYLESLAAPFAQEEKLFTRTLQEMPLALRRRVLHAWLKHHGFCDVSFAEVERVASLLNLQGPAKINLPGKRHARRRAGVIFLT
ncbi:MAG: tRNA lysidine(34) synthetase TilS [Verrucomicrobia bacterium RIFCSPHIGHO2_12_FULL_41_10]|nr:MAG: tRNA lysidine(34) synthetase TilS [Verrucomicrobia bacterium RIFCSPHIGHO2_12_FULL_41_10]HLB34287.1 tRNA lysidine(34) synthetase TilS [Chthoniobacterales bacterium]